MALFDTPLERTAVPEATTVIAQGARVTGRVRTRAPLHVDGEVDGTVDSATTVTVGGTGLVRGTVKAERLVVAGRFEGTAECVRIELAAGGRAEGKLISSELVVEAGGVFEGRSIHRSDPVALRDISAGRGSGGGAAGGDPS